MKQTKVFSPVRPTGSSYRLMARLLCIVVLALTVALPATAQQPGGQQPQQSGQQQRQRLTREQLAERQARYIAGQMALDDKTTARFVETYTAYQKEVWALGPSARRQKRTEQTDADVEQAVRNRLERGEKLQQLRLKYFDKYRKFLSPRQVERVYQLERQELGRMNARFHKQTKGPRRRGK